MSAFPDIRAPHPDYFSQRQYKAQLRASYESGVIQSRCKFTGTIWLFTFGWPQNAALTHAEYNMLVTFFEENQGGIFDYTHWITNDPFKLGFSDNELPEAIPVSNTHWSLTGLHLEGKEVS